MREHEYETVVLFTEKGNDVELIPKSNKMGVHSPDILMDGEAWEIKSPKGEGRYLMSNTIQRAVKQSPNVIVDLRRTKRHQTKCLAELMKEFEKSKSIRQMKIVKKDKTILEIRK